jgi:hypothetical protein
MKSYLSAKQVAQRLNGAISVKQIYRLIHMGKLKVNRNLGKILIEEESLERLLAGPEPEQEVVPSEPPPPSRKPGRPKKHLEPIELW